MTRSVLAMGDRAFLVEVDGVDEAIALHRAVTLLDPDWAIDVVPAAATVLVRFAEGASDEARHVLATLPAVAVDVADASSVAINVRYDGPDLADVARLLDLSSDEVVARHVAANWRVAHGGFAPGFAYLVTDDLDWDLPRRATPRTSVPAGSVGLAGTYSGVYPRASPGGWQLIGTTDAVLWDASRSHPALLEPGVAVRFVVAS